jgi:hypothetical protein
MIGRRVEHGMLKIIHRFGTTALFVAGAIALLAAPAQSQRGQPRTAFATSDFGKLRWLEGTWRGTAPGHEPFYERYHFVNDSTAEITYYNDASLSRPTGEGRVYLTVGRIYHTFGPGRWGATHVDSSGVFFIPQVNAHNTFAWHQDSPNSWTATLRTGLSGHARVTVYTMTRVGAGP